MRPAALPLAALASLALPAAADAQGRSDYAYGTRFFERVTVGDVEITPVGVLEDTRCPDPMLCFRRDALLVSAILWDRRGKREIVLRRDGLTPVPGGALLLTQGGTAPALNGATPLADYRLDIVFVRFPEPGGS